VFSAVAAGALRILAVPPDRIDDVAPERLTRLAARTP
jgi:hypothetical protein